MRKRLCAPDYTGGLLPVTLAGGWRAAAVFGSVIACRFAPRVPAAMREGI